MEDHNRFLRGERDSLRRVLPARITGNAVLFHAIEMTTGFQAWRRLRQDQSLSAKEALNVLRYTVDCLVDGK
jgi:hypothetical protein